jgi:hypothetical protein
MPGIKKRSKIASRQFRDEDGNFITEEKWQNLQKKMKLESGKAVSSSAAEDSDSEDSDWIIISEDFEDFAIDPDERELFVELETNEGIIDEVVAQLGHRDKSVCRDVNEALEWTKEAEKGTINSKPAFGTAGRSLRRHALERNELIQNAVGSHKVTVFFKPVSGVELPMKKSPVELLIAEYNALIERLNQCEVAVINKDSASDKRRQHITKYEYLQYICVLRFFEGISENLLREGHELQVQVSTKISEVIFKKSKTSSYKSQCIRNWAKFYRANKFLPIHHQGKHAKTFSFIHDEGNCELLRECLRAMPEAQRTPQYFLKKLKEEIFPSMGGLAPDEIDEKTAVNWMRYLGFDRVKGQKGYYVDGHERDDVVAYRNEVFLPKMDAYLSRMGHWDENDVWIPPILNEGEKEVVLLHYS